MFSLQISGVKVSGYLTVHVHRTGETKERVWYAGENGSCMLAGLYTNNPHFFIRYDVNDSSDKRLAVILSQFKKSRDMNYTIAFFCSDDFELNPPQPTLPHHAEISSTWSTYTAGGPIGSNSYHTNPKYSILIPCDKTDETNSAELQLSLSTSATTAVNAMLYTVTRRSDKVVNSTNHAIIDTGKYRHGFVVSNRTTIPPGEYILIVSNYHVGQTGFYTLKVSSNVANVMLKRIS
jgi:hypothetical protein